jgi:hypothetical protein
VKQENHLILVELLFEKVLYMCKTHRWKVIYSHTEELLFEKVLEKTPYISEYKNCNIFQKKNIVCFSGRKHRYPMGVYVYLLWKEDSIFVSIIQKTFKKKTYFVEDIFGLKKSNKKRRISSKTYFVSKKNDVFRRRRIWSKKTIKKEENLNLSKKWRISSKKENLFSLKERRISSQKEAYRHFEKEKP